MRTRSSHPRPLWPEFTALLLCASACPGAGGGATPETTSGASEGTTEALTPTTSASQGDPTSATEPPPTSGSPTSATGPATTTTGPEATGTDTGTTAAVDPLTSTGETTATSSASTGTTTTGGTDSAASDSDTTTTDTDSTTADTTDTGVSDDPLLGAVDCPKLEFGDPIIVDDFPDVDHPARHMPPIAIAWRDEMVLARAQRRYVEPGCDVWWDRRDDLGQKLGETVKIPIPATDDEQQCEMVGDIAWDAAHQRYIVLHPLAVSPGSTRSLPLAISPEGALVWTASGMLRPGRYWHGVSSQMRIVGDELYVLGPEYSQSDSARPAVYVYSTVDGAWLRTVKSPMADVNSGAIMCDENCAEAGFVGNQGGLYFWRMDLTTGQLVGAAKWLGDYSWLVSPMLDWRPDDSFYMGRVMYYGVKDQKFETVAVPPNGSFDLLDSVQLPTYGFNSWYDWYEPSWVRTDDGYVIVATRFPWHSELNTNDATLMRVQVWNVGFDGEVRESTLLGDLRALAPRVAIKEGRVAITYVHVREQYEATDSKRLVFASCPP